MFQTHYAGKVRSAERSRARFSQENRTYFLYNPPTYEKYKTGLINFFNTYENDDSLAELFDPNKIVYGLSVKLIFKIKSRGKNPFHGRRPDVDNLYKAVADSLFQSNVNLIPDGDAMDKEGNLITDEHGNPMPKYKQKIDDSRIIHTEILKLRVDTKEEEGFSITIRNVGKEDIQ